MKKRDVKGELYTFKNDGRHDIEFCDTTMRNIFNHNSLNIELIKIKKSNKLGYFYDDNADENKIETIDFFYILEGIIRFEKKDKTLQKRDAFSVSSIARDTEYIVLKDLELIHITLENQDSYMEMLEGMKNLTETGELVLEKDTYTDGHNYRVCIYAKDIATKLELDINEISAIGIAAKFHDVGKVEIEDEVLFKQGKLTDSEFEHIKNHTRYGYDMTKDYPNPNIPMMIKQHHERLDGTGYPEGVSGDELLYGSQIISVADIYDALVTRRPYKEPIEAKVALNILYENAEKHYKKEIVDALKEILVEKELI